MQQKLIKKQEEIELIRRSCDLVSRTLGKLKAYIRPGVSTRELDDVAEAYIALTPGAQPAFKHYRMDRWSTPFPATLCTSINDRVVHGIPTDDLKLEAGDLISVDCGVRLDGYYGDSAFTFAVGRIHPDLERLMTATRASLERSLRYAVHGARVGAISYSIERSARQYGCTPIKSMVGHGVGVQLHEPPDVPNYGRRTTGELLKSGMVLAIEPMLTQGRCAVATLSDGWTIVTMDASPTAHFEHTVVVRKGEPEVLTTFKYMD